MPGGVADTCVGCRSANLRYVGEGAIDMHGRLPQLPAVTGSIRRRVQAMELFERVIPTLTGDADFGEIGDIAAKLRLGEDQHSGQLPDESRRPAKTFSAASA